MVSANVTIRKLCIVALGMSAVGFCFGHERQWNFGVRHAGGLVAYGCRDSKGPNCATEEVIRDFEKWRDAGPKVFESPPCASTEASLDGLWRRSSFLDEGSHIKLSIGQGDAALLTYWSAGHIADYSFSRAAEYDGSELRLDGPVVPYAGGPFGGPYFQLFTARLGGTLYLVPGPAVHWVAEAAEGNSCDKIDPHEFGGAIFRRLSESEAKDAWLPGPSSGRRPESK
jgi:hypothetical protein